MTKNKIITNNDDNKSSNASNASSTSNTQNPAENRKRHMPVKGLPRV